VNLIPPQEKQVWQSPWFWAGLLLLFYGILRLVTGYDGMYGQDPYAYYNYARAIQAYWREGTPLGPFVWPRIYPLLGALWLWGDPGGWMQCLSMGGSALTLAMCIKLLQAAQPTARLVAPVAFLAVGLSPFLLRYSLSVLSDTLALGFMTWALWQGERYLQTLRGKHLLAAALLTGLAIWTRYPVAILMVIPCCIWSWHALKNRAYVALGLFLPVMLVAAIPHFFLLPHPAKEGIGHVFQNTNFVQWSPWHAFQREFVQVDGLQQFSTPNILASFGFFWHPRYLGLGLVGVAALLLRKRLRLPPIRWADLGSVLLCGLFLAGVPFQNARFHVPMLPFVGRILGPAWVRCASYFEGRPWLGRATFGIVCVIQLGLGLFALRTVAQAGKTERAIAADLNALPHPQRLYEFSLQAMLQARCPQLETVSLWDSILPPPAAGDLAIFNETAFAEQFAGRTPMRNWQAIQVGYVLHEITTWEGGWKLYAIQ
jgi:4-amino-4-deoxy-L-arabinose transferase-like glycosyltransferase